jgi:hypothetical protein
LDERFGVPEMVEAAIKERLSSFPRIGNKDNKKLYELVDIMIEISELNEDLIVFACLPESGPSQRISKSISSDGVTFSSDIMPLEIDFP